MTKINETRHITKDGIIKRNPKKTITQAKAKAMAEKEIMQGLKLIPDGERFASNGTYNYPHGEYEKYNASDVKSVEVITPIEIKTSGPNAGILMTASDVYYIMNDGTEIREYNPEIWFEYEFM